MTAKSAGVGTIHLPRGKTESTSPSLLPPLLHHCPQPLPLRTTTPHYPLAPPPPPHPTRTAITITITTTILDVTTKATVTQSLLHS